MKFLEGYILGIKDLDKWAQIPQHPSESDQSIQMTHKQTDRLKRNLGYSGMIGYCFGSIIGLWSNLPALIVNDIHEVRFRK